MAWISSKKKKIKAKSSEKSVSIMFPGQWLPALDSEKKASIMPIWQGKKKKEKENSVIWFWFKVHMDLFDYLEQYLYSQWSVFNKLNREQRFSRTFYQMVNLSFFYSFVVFIFFFFFIDARAMIIFVFLCLCTHFFFQPIWEILAQNAMTCAKPETASSMYDKTQYS